MKVRTILYSLKTVPQEICNGRLLFEYCRTLRVHPQTLTLEP